VAADVVVVQVAHVPRQPGQHAQVLLDRLLDPVEVVPDAGVGRVQAAHSFDVARLDRSQQTVSEVAHARSPVRPSPNVRTWTETEGVPRRGPTCWLISAVSSARPPARWR